MKFFFFGVGPKTWTEPLETEGLEAIGEVDGAEATRDLEIMFLYRRHLYKLRLEAGGKIGHFFCHPFHRQGSSAP